MVEFLKCDNLKVTYMKAEFRCNEKHTRTHTNKLTKSYHFLRPVFVFSNYIVIVFSNCI